MSWAKDLWDQYDSVSIYTQNGTDFMEKYGNFLEKRCKIEQEYATKVRQLVKVYTTKNICAGELEEQELTCQKALRKVLNEHNDIAGQHELIAEGLSNLILDEIRPFVKALRHDRKKYLQEATNTRSLVQASLVTLNKAEDKYTKGRTVRDKALSAFQKVDADFNLSRAEVEKFRTNLTIRSKECENLKSEYTNQLGKTNSIQNEYYHHSSPRILQSLQDWDEKRIVGIQTVIYKAIEIERGVLPIIAKCLDEMVESANYMDKKHDAKAVVEMYKSGFVPPDNIAPCDVNTDIENMSIGTLPISGRPTLTSHQSKNDLLPNQSIHDSTLVGEKGDNRRKSSFLLTLKGGKNKKIEAFREIFGGSRDDCSDLPPNQRRKKLLAKTNELQKKICQETSVHDALIKMKQVYEANPALGDPNSINKQLTENDDCIRKLKEQEDKLLEFLHQTGSNGNDIINLKRQASSVSNKSRTSVVYTDSDSDNVDSTTIEFISPNYTSSVLGSVNDSEGDDKTSPINLSCESPLKDGSQVTGLQFVNVTQENKTSKFADKFIDEIRNRVEVCNPFIQSDTNEIIERKLVDKQFRSNKCKALYPFITSCEGTVSMSENEVFSIVEDDNGDGWTRVKRIWIKPSDQEIEGYVPTSYIERIT